MSSTYDINLADDISWVRSLIRDTDTSAPFFQDEEISAYIAAQNSNGLSGGNSSAVYLAAAELLSILHRKWMTRGAGVVSRTVSRLSIVYGSGSGINVDITLQESIKALRIKGAKLLMPADTPYSFFLFDT